MMRLDETLQKHFKLCKEDAVLYGSDLITTSIYINVMLKEKEQTLMEYFGKLNIKNEKAILLAKELVMDSCIKNTKSQVGFILAMENTQYFLTAELMEIVNCAYINCHNKELDVLQSSNIVKEFIDFMPRALEEIIYSLSSNLKESLECYIQDLDTIDEDEDDEIEIKSINKDSKILDDFIFILNESKDIDKGACILSRDHEIESIFKILLKERKSNAILVGKPGVGKTAIIERLAWLIEKGQCPERLKNHKVGSLSVNSLIAGTKYRGEAEKRFEVLIKFLENNSNIILFIDEIHLMLGAGSNKEGELDFANALKPILANGVTKMIGATTDLEYKYFARDPALKRRFEKIEVKEPKDSEIYPMLKQRIKNLEEFHNVTITKKMVEAAIFYSKCFNNETANPDRTVDLIDKSMVATLLKGENKVTQKRILENFEINFKKFKLMSTNTKMGTAYHEVGHFLVWLKYKDILKDREVSAISIMPAENYLGITVFDNTDLIPETTREYFLCEIAMFQAGRIAEKMFTDNSTEGAKGDLEIATEIARKMVTEYGLSIFSTNRTYKELQQHPRIIKRIEEEISVILDDANELAQKALKENTQILMSLVNLLYKKGILSKAEITKCINNIPVFK